MLPIFLTISFMYDWQMCITQVYYFVLKLCDPNVWSKFHFIVFYIYIINFIFYFKILLLQLNYILIKI